MSLIRTENIVSVHKESNKQLQSLENYKPDTYYFFSNKNINQTVWWAASLLFLLSYGALYVRFQTMDTHRSLLVSPCFPSKTLVLLT